MLKIVKENPQASLVCSSVALFYVLLVVLNQNGVGASSILGLLSLGAMGLWWIIRVGETKLPVCILGMGLLLPSFQVVSGLPHVRPEELVVVFFLLYLLLKKEQIKWNGTKELGVILGALIVSTGYSLLFSILFLDCRFSYRDLFELLKPVKYYLIMLLIARINFSELKLIRVMKYFWLFSGGFMLAGFLEYFNPFGFEKLLTDYAPLVHAHSRLASQRLMGLMGNPNYSGIMLMAIIAIAFSFLIFRNNTTKENVLYLSMFNLAGILLFLTMSRTAMLATVLVLVYLGGTALFLRVLSRRKVLIGAGIILLIMAIFLGVAGDQFLWRFAAGFDLGTSTSFQARVGFWEAAVDAIKQSPVLGWGPAKLEMSTLVDNEYLLIARRYGMIGLAIYLALYLNILYRSGRLAVSSRTTSVKAFAYAVQAITGGFLVFNITAGTFYNLQIMSVFFALVGILLGLERASAETDGGDRDGKDSAEKDSAEKGSAEVVKTGKSERQNNSLLIVLSHRFPNGVDPIKGIYVQEQLEAIAEAGPNITPNISVISPIPWAPRILWSSKKWRTYGQVEKHSVFRGWQVYYPRYLVIPGASFFFLQSFFMLLSIYTLVDKLVREYDQVIVHAHTILPDGLAAVFLKRCLNKNIKLVCTVHGSDLLVFPHRNKITFTLTKQALSKMDELVCVSNHLKHTAEGLGTSRSVVISNGVNVEKFTLNQDELDHAEQIRGQWQGKQLILFIGNLFETKGIKELLTAFRDLAGNNVLLLVGQPYLQEYVAEFAQANKLQDDVVVVGPVPHSQIKLWLWACDLFVLPSYSEGMPVVMLEAMSMGKPVIISNVGGVPEVVSDGVNGLLIPPRDSAALKQALQKLLANPQLAAELGRAARKTIQQQYTWAANAERLLSIYSRWGWL